jgi:hypothetical protein
MRIGPARAYGGRVASQSAGRAEWARFATRCSCLIGRMAPPGGVAILAFAQTLLRGALVVLIAVLAVRVLGLDAADALATRRLSTDPPGRGGGPARP